MANNKNPDIIRCVMLLHKDTVADIQKLKKERRYITDQEAYRFLINYAMEKLNPAYVRAMKDRPSKMTEAEKIEHKVQFAEKMKQAKKDKELESQQSICDRLGGTVEVINGINHCRYNKYIECPGKTVDVSSMLEPFEALDEQTLNYQFYDLFNRTGPEVTEKIKKMYFDQYGKEI
jgi:hypothetical protein